MAGKGDRRRPTNQKQWDEGWERIFGGKTVSEVSGEKGPIPPLREAPKAPPK